MQTKPETLDLAKYVLVFTTHHDGSAMEILERLPNALANRVGV